MDMTWQNIQTLQNTQLSSTEGSFAAIDPASPSSQGIIGHYEGNGLVSIDSCFPLLINCTKGLRKNACPALPKLEELGSLRNKRFLNSVDSPDSIYSIEFELRVGLLYSILGYEKTIRVTSYHSIWGFIMKFGHFDFPVPLANNEQIYL